MAIVRSEGFYEEGFYDNENPLTPAGIEPATFRFVTQHLNHCATAVLQWYSLYQKVREKLVKWATTQMRSQIYKGMSDTRDIAPVILIFDTTHMSGGFHAPVALPPQNEALVSSE